MNILKVATFLKNYANNEYKSPTKLLGKEREKNEKIKLEAREAKDEFNEFCFEIASKYKYVIIPESQFLNGSKTKVRSYFWTRLKSTDENKWNIPFAICIFCEKHFNNVRLRISIEMELSHINDNYLVKYSNLLNIPLEDTLSYEIYDNHNNYIESTNDPSRVKKLLSSNKTYRFEISKVINILENTNNEEVLLSFEEGITILKKYYNFVIDEK